MHRTLPLITTTQRSGTNPGDTYIGTGLQWLVEKVTGPDTPWQLINKFDRDEMKSWLPEMQRAGIVLYGGTPQYNNYGDWKVWYDDELWRKMINPAKVRTAVFAGGAGHIRSAITPEEFAKHCASDRKTVKIIRQRTEHALCFTVRDRHSHALLNELGIENTLLPCSATFSGLYYRIEPSVVAGRYGIVTPKPSFVPFTKPEEVIDRFHRIMAIVREMGKTPVLICHGKAEYLAYRDRLGQDEIFYTSDYHALLKYFGTCEGMISARLHASLPAWGIGGIRRIVNISIDVRGNAVEMVGMPNLDYADASPERIEQLLSTTIVDDADRAERIRQATASYGAIIRSALNEAGWPVTTTAPSV